MSFQKRILWILISLSAAAVIVTALVLTLTARQVVVDQAESDGRLIAEQFVLALQSGAQLRVTFDALANEHTISREKVNAIWITDGQLTVLANRQAPDLDIGADLLPADRSLLQTAINENRTQSSLDGNTLKVAAPMLDSARHVTGAALLFLPTAVQQTQQAMLGRAILLAILALVAGFIAARQLMRPLAESLNQLTAAADAVEAGSFEPDRLNDLAAGSGEFGQHTRVFLRMARSVMNRELRLKQALQELPIAVDEERKVKQVAELTERDYFQHLQQKAAELRTKMATLSGKPIEYLAGGISATDLAELPPGQQALMRLILRKSQMSYPELCAAAEGLKDNEHLDQLQLNEALVILSDQQWLIKSEDEGQTIYKVNLRRHGGTFGKATAGRNAESALPKAIWDALNSAGEQQSTKRKTSPHLDL